MSPRSCSHRDLWKNPFLNHSSLHCSSLILLNFALTSEVAIRLQRGLNSTSMMIDRLKKLGLVTRTRSDSDRRENYLELTPAGREKVAKGKKINTLVAQRLARVLTEKDVRDLSNILNKLEEQAIKEMGKTGTP